MNTDPAGECQVKTQFENSHQGTAVDSEKIVLLHGRVCPLTLHPGSRSHCPPSPQAPQGAAPGPPPHVSSSPCPVSIQSLCLCHRLWLGAECGRVGPSGHLATGCYVLRKVQCLPCLPRALMTALDAALIRL